MSIRVARVCALLALSACASTAGSAAGVGAATPQAASRDRNLISQEELSAPDVRARSVLDYIRTARPHFLTQRGKNSHSDAEAGKVHVSIDNGRILPVEELQNIHAGTVIEIRYLEPSAAMQKFGGAAREGPVILVRTIK